MGKPVFTADQQHAIDTRKNEILVSAAAGSGKTAVLIERITQLLFVDKLPITEIVVLTFTNAAASQMRDRLKSKLYTIIQDAQASEGDRQLAQEQLLLLPLANISTFHAFCIKQLRNYYQYIGISPKFKIIDEAANALLKEEILDEVIDMLLTEQNENFAILHKTFVQTTNIKPLRQLLLAIYGKTRAFPHPEKWLHHAISWCNNEKQIQQLVQSYQDSLLRKVVEWKQLLITAQQYVYMQQKNTDFLFSIITELEELETQIPVDLDLAITTMRSLKFGRWPTIKTDDKTFDTEKGHSVYKLFKKQFDAESKQLYTPDAIKIEQLNNLPVVQALVSTLQVFTKRYQEQKLSQNYLDFSDIEHLMIQLVEEHEEVKKEMGAAITEILVDEYQDTNAVQDFILSQLRTPKNRIFMVGDVKQSIYRFRLADPSIFMEKEHTFSGNNQDLILLNNNFRSRQQVLMTINDIFYELFKIDIIYSDEIALHFKNTAYDPLHDGQTHIHFYEEPEVKTYHDINEEKAKIIFNQVLSVLNSQEIYDLGIQAFRPVTFKDIAILHRNRTSDTIYALQNLFETEGIPFTSPNGTGYFDAVEVKNILSLLHVLDNPYNTIELVSYMRSPLSQFTDNDLLLIKQHKSNESPDHFYNYLLNILASSDEELVDLQEKIASMLQQLEIFQKKLAIYPLPKVLSFILDDTKYVEFVAQLPNGVVRVANLTMLIELAESREEYGVMSLRLFIRYMKKLQENNQDFAIAKVSDGQADAIQMMTIHGSKGLEFPFVFIIDLDKKFNQMDSRSIFQISRSLGLALRQTDIKTMSRTKTWHYNLIAENQKREEVAEQLRVLYVALTRAEHGLHLFLDAPKEEFTEQALTEIDVMLADSFGEWIRRALFSIKNKQVIEVFENNYAICKHELGSELLLELDYISSDSSTYTDDITLEKNARLAFEKHLHYKYPFMELQQFPQKQTVTEVKRKLDKVDMLNEPHSITIKQDHIEKMADNEIELRRPSFLDKAKLTPMEKGTLYHFVLQQYDFDNFPDVSAHLERLVEYQYITKGEQLELSEKNIKKVIEQLKVDFLDRGFHIIAKEVAFSMTEQAKKLYGESELFTDELVAIQGKIDLLLCNGEEYVVVDYKTDKHIKNQPLDYLENKYKIQMQLYMQAVKDFYQTERVSFKIYPIMYDPSFKVKN